MIKSLKNQDKKRNILIIGAGREQVPLIMAAKNLGLNVIAVDKDFCSPGFKYCDIKKNVNILDSESCLDIARQHAIAAAVTSTEAGLETAAYICERLRLVGNYTSTILSIKSKFIQAAILKKNNLPVPQTQKVSHASEVKKLQFPLVIKPPDAAAARGVFLVNSVSDFKQRFNQALQYTTLNYVIAQEYIDGKEVGAEVVVQDAQVKGVYLTDKTSSSLPFFVVMGHKMPAMLSKPMAMQIYRLIKKVVKVFHIKDSLINFDFKIKNTTPYILEFGSRLGGNYLPYLVKLSGGGDSYQNAIKISLGVEVECLPCSRFAAVSYFGAERDGIIKKVVSNTASLKKLANRIDIFKNPGDFVRPVERHDDRLGCFVVSARNHQLAETKIKQLHEGIKFVIA